MGSEQQARSALQVVDEMPHDLRVLVWEYGLRWVEDAKIALQTDDPAQIELFCKAEAKKRHEKLMKDAAKWDISPVRDNALRRCRVSGTTRAGR